MWKIKKILFAILVATLVIGCNNQTQNQSPNKTNENTQPPPPPLPPPPPSFKLKVETYQERSGRNLSDYLRVQVLTQDLIVREVTINRGGCQTVNQSFGVNMNGPLKFGDTLNYFIMPYPVCNVAEVVVITNLGTQTYNFD